MYHRRNAVRNSTITVSLDTPDQDQMFQHLLGAQLVAWAVYAIARRLFADSLSVFITFLGTAIIAWRTVVAVPK